MSSLFAMEAAVTLPILALAAVTIAGMRLNGLLSDELVAELQLPFSRVTLSVVGVALILSQLMWITGRLSGAL